MSLVFAILLFGGELCFGLRTQKSHPINYLYYCLILFFYPHITFLSEFEAGDKLRASRLISTITKFVI